MKPFGITTGGNVYQLIAEVPNWSADIPNSLINYRIFLRLHLPAYFFQTIVPVTILTLIVSTILLWNSPKTANKWMILSVGGVILAEAFTGIYFLPKNFVLFLDPIEGVSAVQLKILGAQRQTANDIRLTIVVATMFLYLKAYGILCSAKNS